MQENETQRNRSLV